MEQIWFQVATMDRMQKKFLTDEELAEELNVGDSDDEGEYDELEFEEAISSDSDDSYVDPDFDYNPDTEEEEENICDVVQKVVKKASNTSTSTAGPSQSTNSLTRLNKKRPSAKHYNRHERMKTAEPRKRKQKSGGEIDEHQAAKRMKLKCDQIVGRDGNYKWKSEPIRNHTSKTVSKNLVHARQRTKNDALNVVMPLKCFEVFFPETIFLIVLEHTNAEIFQQRKSYKNQGSSTLKDLDMVELRALLGIFILAGAKQDNHMNIKTLHDPTISGERYRALFSGERQHFLMNCLRFDNRETREVRQESDRLAPIRDIWDILIERCISSYEPGPYLTIDEQLVPFRGHCRFRMYIPNKPAKYGMKIVMMCDGGTNYMCNAIPYLGKGTTPAGKPSADYFVEKLVEPVRTSGRNITTDNWFTSIPLAKYLLDQKLTTIGTIRKNKPELPQEFINPKFENRSPNTSLFLFSNDLTAVSFAPKKNKLVTLISTMHDDDAVNARSQKPEIICCYNQTKGAVDAFDQCLTRTSCIRRSRRWPMCFFYNMLNIAAYNSYVVYLHNFFKMNNKTKPLSRFQFLLSIADELSVPWMKCRVQQLHMPQTIICSIQKCITNITGIEDATRSKSQAEAQNVKEPQEGILMKRKYCSYCDYKKKRMSKMKCSICEVPDCGEPSVCAVQM